MNKQANQKIKERIDFSIGILPNIEDEETAAFWEGTRKGEVRFPKCNDCGKFHWYPCLLCPHCHSPNIKWQALTSQPRLFTWTCVRWSLAPAPYENIFEKRGPYIVGLVVFDEAPDLRLGTNLVDCQPEDLTIEMPLEVVFEKVNDKVTLPLFRPMKDKK